jgi:hypothetical protein
MSKKGKLLVLPWIKLQHFEAVDNRPDSLTYWTMSVINRFRLIQIRDKHFLSRVAFFWSLTGQVGALMWRKFFGHGYQEKSLTGIFLAIKQIVKTI